MPWYKLPHTDLSMWSDEEMDLEPAKKPSAPAAEPKTPDAKEKTAE